MDLLKPRYTREDLEILDRRRSLANVARALIGRRIELGFSQEDVGRRASTKQSRVSEIEAMKGNPRLDTLDRIARVLGLAVDLVPRRPVQSLPEGYTAHGSVLRVADSADSARAGSPVNPEAVWSVGAKQGGIYANIS